MLASSLNSPRLSLAERDRRWRIVRSAMSDCGIDCLVARCSSAKWDAHGADARYLTHVGGNGEEGYVVFPLVGEPITFIYHPGTVKWWKQVQDWVTDLRPGIGRFWSDSIVNSLKELGLERGKIGLVGLAATPSEPEGIIPYTTVIRLKEALPSAQFENASSILQDARWTKSDEEIAFIERAGAIADEAVRAMAETARPGVRDWEVYAAVYHAILRQGSEPPMFIWDSGPEVLHPTRFPVGRTLEVGDVIVDEVSPKYAGYFSHIHQPIAVGSASDEYRKMADMALEAFYRGFDALRPGVTLGELEEIFMGPVRAAGYTWKHPTIHGVGLEIPESPRTPMVPDAWRSPYTHKDTALKSGMVLAIQPMVAHMERDIGVAIGDTVAITETGARRLTQHKLGLIVT